MLSILKLCAASRCFKPSSLTRSSRSHLFRELPISTKYNESSIYLLYAGVSTSVKLADILNSLSYCYFCRDTPSQICWYCLCCCANHKVGFWGFLVKIFPKVEFLPQSFYNHSWWKRDHGGVIDNLPWLTIAIGQWPTSMAVYKKKHHINYQPLWSMAMYKNKNMW